LLLGGSVLDRCCDFRGIVEMEKFVLPWSIRLHVPLDILYQIAEVFPFVIACAFVVDIAKRPLDWLFIRPLQSVKSRKHFPTGGERLKAV
jgi:hypothetical protein